MIIHSKYNKENRSFVHKLPYLYLTFSVIRIIILYCIYDFQSLYTYEDLSWQPVVLGIIGFIMFIVSAVTLEKVAVGYYQTIKDKAGWKASASLIAISILDVIITAVMMNIVVFTQTYQLWILGLQSIEILLLIVYLVSKKE